MKQKHIIMLASLILLSACKSQEITTRQVPKETHKIYTKIETLTKESEEWPVPKHWEKVSPERFIKHAYKITAKDKEAKLTVSFLPGNSGSLLANVNRWRKQIGLNPITEKGLNRRIKRHKTSTQNFTLVDLAYSPKSKSKNAQKRILAAITKTTKGTWFFKLQGNRELIETETQNFLEHLENVTL